MELAFQMSHGTGEGRGEEALTHYPSPLLQRKKLLIKCHRCYDMVSV